jgi:hypothetical protein
VALDRASVEYSQFEFWTILSTDRSSDSYRTCGCMAAYSVTHSQRHHLVVGVTGGANRLSASRIALAVSSTLAAIGIKPV